jgi:hypothetical protein
VIVPDRLEKKSMSIQLNERAPSSIQKKLEGLKKPAIMFLSGLVSLSIAKFFTGLSCEDKVNLYNKRCNSTSDSFDCFTLNICKQLICGYNQAIDKIGVLGCETGGTAAGTIIDYLRNRKIAKLKKNTTLFC